MYLDDMVDLIDARLGLTEAADDIVEDAIGKSVSDLSRVYPREQIYDYSFDFDVDDEEITTDADTLATAISLANSMIKALSETVTSEDGETTYTRGTDYSMDYAGGILTPIATGDMEKDTTYLISYTKLKVGVDISGLGDIMRIEKVEYPAGQTPQKFVSFKKWGDYLTLTSRDTSSQEQISSSQRAWVYYLSEHTAPTDEANGTYPEFLDSAIMIGAESYLLEYMAVDLIGDAGDSVTTGLGYLTSGAALINKVNVGKDVPENYGKYAQVCSTLTLSRLEAVDKLRAEAMSRKSEFWAILRSKLQLRIPESTGPEKQ